MATLRKVSGTQGMQSTDTRPTGRKQFFWRTVQIFLLVIVGCLCPMVASAQAHVSSIRLSGGCLYWSDPSCWMPYGVPNNTAQTVYDVTIDATIINSSQVQVYLDMDVTIASLVLGGTRYPSALYSPGCNGLGGSQTLDIAGTFTVNRQGYLQFCGLSKIMVAGNTNISLGKLSFSGSTVGQPTTGTFGTLTNTGQIWLSASQLTATSIANSGSMKIQSSTLSAGDYAQTKGSTWAGYGSAISAKTTVSGGNIVSGGNASFDGDLNLQAGTITVPLYHAKIPGSGIPISGNYTQGDAANMSVELGKVDCKAPR